MTNREQAERKHQQTRLELARIALAIEDESPTMPDKLQRLRTNLLESIAGAALTSDRTFDHTNDIEEWIDDLDRHAVATAEEQVRLTEATLNVRAAREDVEREIAAGRALRR